MPALKPYTVVVDGNETTLLLSPEDAKARGLVEDKPRRKPAAKAAPAPANKARAARTA